jgi:hypothetical protein
MVLVAFHLGMSLYVQLKVALCAGRACVSDLMKPRANEAHRAWDSNAPPGNVTVPYGWNGPEPANHKLMMQCHILDYSSASVARTFPVNMSYVHISAALRAKILRKTAYLFSFGSCIPAVFGESQYRG